MRKCFCVIMLFVIMLFVQLIFLSACQRVVQNPSDELTVSSWSQKFDNGVTVSLCFDDDNATLQILTDIKQSTTKISGFCELSDNSFVIHDIDTGVPYSFNYDISYDHVDISYDGKLVSLNKQSD